MGHHGSRPVVDVRPPAGGILKEKKECWSYSQLNQIANICALQYKFQRIDRLEPEFAPQNLVYGSSVHMAASWLFRLRRDGASVKSAEIQEIFSETLAKQVKESGRVLFEDGDSLESLQADGRQIVDLLVQNQRDDEKVLDVDVSFDIPLRNSRGETLAKPLVGEIDLLVARGREGRLTVKDLKTSKKRYAEEKLKHDLQPSVYVYALTQLHPEEEVGPFTWEVLIKNKKPELVPYQTTRGPADFDRLFALARTADRLVTSGAFLPNRGGFWCKSCPFQGACREWHLS